METNHILDLMINRLPGISVRDRVSLCKELDSIEELSVLSKKDLCRTLGRNIPRDIPPMEHIYKAALEDSRRASLLGISCVSYRDRDYPPLLRELADPPLVLFYRGPLPDPEQMLVGMVGTRKPSAPAMAQCYDFAKALGEAGIPVVSGLALGIDGMAHRGNLEGGAPTVAVLGSGVDAVYPVSNRMIARRILDNGGCIMSEYAPGTGPAKWHFPARNRIISGLSRGVIVAEAPVKSGALITAQFALEQGRDLWVAGAGIAGVSGEGTRALHLEGAPVINTIQTLFDEWGIRAKKESLPVVSFSGANLAAGLARSLNIEL